jgi:uncharacterized protein
LADVTKALTLALPAGTTVPASIHAPQRPWAGYVFAHGAGAGMDHPFMTAIAAGLAERGVATLRFQFPFMEHGGKRPDPPRTAHAAVRAAVQQARKRLGDLPVFAGGRSYGGRMTSQAHAAEPLAGLRGIAFLGFPLHAAGKPSLERAAHLAGIDVPMLFLQGTRDPLAELRLVQQAVSKLGSRAILHIVDAADHSFHVLARSGRTDAQVRDELLDTMTAWMNASCQRASRTEARSSSS